MSAAVANPAGLARAGETRLKLPKMQRSILMEAPIVDSEQRSITFPFSSTFPVERWFGQEVLSHESGAADLSRLNDGAPLLYNHDPNQLIGVVERAWIDGGRGYVTARFSQNDLAQQVMGDVADNVLRNVSFGYRVMNMVSDGTEGDSATFTATRWAPYEISLVTIPADPTVGIGREEPTSDNEVTVSNPEPVEPAQPASTPTPESRDLTMENTSVNFDEVRSEAVAAERARIASISKLGEKFNQADMARQLIDGGKSIDEARSAFLEKLGSKQEPIADKAGVVDMSEREQADYSLVRAINASLSGNWSKAGFEREISQEIERQTGKATSGFFMPHNLSMRAPYAVGSATTGGNLVATNLLAGSFIEVLRNKALIMNLGPTLLTGLVGNVAIPRQTSATNTYWVTEAATVTEAEALFDQVTLSPKQIGARSQYSRLALQQATPDIEMVVRNDLARVMALGIDAAAIYGTGSSGQPKGILNQSGVGSVAMGTNGAAFTNSSTSSTSGIDQLIQLEKAVDSANALTGSLCYLSNPKVVSAIKQLKTQYADYLWSSNTDDRTAGTPININGYPMYRSNQVPSNLTKGSGTGLSAVIFGDFSSLVIGMWGALEVLVNPYGSGYNAGSVDIRTMQTCDINVRHPESFAVISDVLA
jgi:HK97 family phage major capsid protein/HK97 family phage prohead protease